jgi:hypothetical protein
MSNHDPPPPSDPNRPIDEAERAALLARLAELKARSEALQERISGPRLPGWVVALRVGGALAVWGGLIAVGAWFLGLWGGIGGLLAPVAAFFLYAVGSYYGGMLVRGTAQPIGDLSVDLDAEARLVTFAWSGDDATLPLGLLAHLDLGIWTWAASPHLAKPGLWIAAAARECAEIALKGKPVAISEWTAMQGPARERAVMVVRDRLGVGYGFASSIGGPKPSNEEAREMQLALIDLGLTRPDGKAFARAVVAIADYYQKGGTERGKALGKVAGDFLPKA